MRDVFSGCCMTRKYSDRMRVAAAETVSDDAGEGASENGPDQGAAHVPSHLQGVERKVAGDLTDRSGNDGRVVSEQKAAEGRYRSQKTDIIQVRVWFLHRICFIFIYI